MIQLLIGLPVMVLVIYLVACMLIEAHPPYTRRPAWSKPGIFLVGLISYLMALAVILVLTYGIGSAIWIVLGHTL